MEQTEKQSAESLCKLLKATPMMLANDNIEVNIFSNKIRVKDNVKNIIKHYNVLKEEFDEDINGYFVLAKDANNIKYFLKFCIGLNNEKYFLLKLYQGENLLKEKVKLVNLLK
ncbi:hypothetical protein [Empedobacter brevis]|uniref:hypothetical protein n=1 Tax=Empedobacter brevis TaxID=247 RepID=UPI0028D3CE59|nr:hypothetical protein [Empedobacter brevis]